jgi:hypothetical protein
LVSWKISILIKEHGSANSSGLSMKLKMPVGMIFCAFYFVFAQQMDTVRTGTVMFALNQTDSCAGAILIANKAENSIAVELDTLHILLDIVCPGYYYLNPDAQRVNSAKLVYTLQEEPEEKELIVYFNDNDNKQTLDIMDKQGDIIISKKPSIK